MLKLRFLKPQMFNKIHCTKEMNIYTNEPLSTSMENIIEGLIKTDHKILIISKSKSLMNGSIEYIKHNSCVRVLLLLAVVN